MNYRINGDTITIRLTERAVDGVAVFGTLNQARDGLGVEVNADIREMKARLAVARKVRERDLPVEELTDGVAVTRVTEADILVSSADSAEDLPPSKRISCDLLGLPPGGIKAAARGG